MERLPLRATQAPRSRQLLRPLLLTALLVLLMAGAALFINPPEPAAADSTPLWVNDLGYGSTGGGFYWDSNSNLVWTGERGWHSYGPRPARQLWVDFIFYGSAGGGFYLDPLTGQVWTAERGWHRFDPRPPRDSDGDGVPDMFDACPYQPGPISNHGCPVLAPPLDSDGDGVPDAVDACPYVPGPAWNHGCPVQTQQDSDGDGVPDALDACPYQPGPAWNHGCPVVAIPQVHIWIDRGNGAIYHLGEGIRVCYTVSMPWEIRIVDYTADGLHHTLLAGFDDGRGGCFNAIVTLPYGHERIVIYARGDQFQNPYQSNVLAQDETSFNVVP